MTAGIGSSSRSRSGRRRRWRRRTRFSRSSTRGDSLPELAAYVSRCAAQWNHAPAPCEIEGGSYIARRFGSWEAALAAAGLSSAYKIPRNKENRRYQKEKRRQTALHKEERDAKRAAKREKAREHQRADAMRAAAKKRPGKKKTPAQWNCPVPTEQGSVP